MRIGHQLLKQSGYNTRMAPNDVDTTYKHKSGALKRKDKDRLLLNSAASDPKQRRLCFSSTDCQKSLSTERGGQMSIGASVALQIGEPAVAFPLPVCTQQLYECAPVATATTATNLTQNVDHVDVFTNMSPQKVLQNPSVTDLKIGSAADNTANECITEVESPGDKLRSVCFVTDKALYKHVTQAELCALVSHGACQPLEKDFPDGQYPRNASLRHFSSSAYFIKNALDESVRVKWLAYSYKEDYAYCHYCWLLGDHEAKHVKWVQGFSDWRRLGQSMMIHAKSKSHMRSTLAFLAYNNDQSIETFIDRQISEEAKKWHEVLTILLDIVRSLSTLGMPFRGHRENLDGLNCGLFLTVVKLIARYNPTFNAHLNSQSRIKYVSKTITDELIGMIALETRKSILDLCKEAKFFTLIADSTTDISHVDQMAILVRYVHIDREKNNVTINESFLSFIDLQQADAAALCSRIVNVLFGEYGLNRNYLCGQGYDGASVMSGARGGLQAKIKDYLGVHLYAPYIHCPAHQINLVLVHAAENRASPTTKCFFAVIQSVYTYFAFSNRRWALLLKKAEHHAHLTSLAQESDSIVTKANAQLDDICNFDALEDCDGIPQEESSSTGENEYVAPTSASQEYEKPHHVPLRLKALCETRWFARLKAVDAMKENFLNIIECLEDEAHAQRSNGEDVMKARTLLLSMDWVFYLNLLWWQKVLTVMDAVARILQSKSIDLFLVAETFKVTIQKLQNLRSDDAYFDFIKCAREEWEAMGLERNDFPVQRERRVPRRDGETLRDVVLSPLEKHKLGYFEVLDNMLGEMRERCNGFQEVSELFGFLQPQRLSVLSSVELGKPVELLLKKYSVFSHELLGNLVLFQTYYFGVQKHVKTGSACPTSTVLNYLQFIISSSLEDVLPEMSMLCRIFLTLPIGIASAERSMSTLRRVKNYMRSTMTQKRLSDLALLAIEQDTVYNLDLSKLIEAFAKAKARRGSVFQ